MVKYTCSRQLRMGLTWFRSTCQPGLMSGAVQVRPLPGIGPNHVHGLHSRRDHLGLGVAPAAPPAGAAQGAKEQHECSRRNVGTRRTYAGNIAAWFTAYMGCIMGMIMQVKVQALDFSHDERYLASLGGQDDNALVRAAASIAATAVAAATTCLWSGR